MILDPTQRRSQEQKLPLRYGAIRGEIEVTGEAVELEGSDGASDARFLSASGINAIITQPTIGNSHRIDEWIDVDSMVQLFVIYERFIENRGANRLPGSDTP